MRLIGYINASVEPALLDLRHGMQYLMNHPPLTYHVFQKENSRVNMSQRQCFFKAGSAEIKKIQE